MSNKKGLGIIAAVIILLIIAVMGVVVVSFLNRNTAGTVNYVQSQQAFYLAESGVQKAFLALNRDNWSGWAGTDPKTMQGSLADYGDYDISVASITGDTPRISTWGFVPGRSASGMAVRRVDVKAIKTNLFQAYAAFAGGSGSGNGVAIKLAGNSFTDSYDSSKGAYNTSGSDGQLNKGADGDVGTNTDIAVFGKAHIYGDASTGAGGIFSDQSAVTGKITHEMNIALPEVVVPSGLLSLPQEGSVDSSRDINGNHKFTAINLSGGEVLTVAGPASIYLTGPKSINITGAAAIIVSSSSIGPVVIYVDGSVYASGQGIVNSGHKPVDFQLYGTSGCKSIDISGQGDFYGLVYAPQADLKIGGQGELFGSYIGNTLQISGSTKGGLHHDVSVGAGGGFLPGFIPGLWRPKDWTEVY